MHELSIAQSLIELLDDQLAGEGPVRVSRVRVAVGVLAAVVPEALQTAFGIAARQTRYEGARLEIETVPVTVFCDSCGEMREVADPPRLHCAVCGTLAKRMAGGMELELRAVEVLDPGE